MLQLALYAFVQRKDFVSLLNSYDLKLKVR